MVPVWMILSDLLPKFQAHDIIQGQTRTRSLSNATFSFLITWRSSSSKSAAVYKISWKSDDFSLRYGHNEIWQYIDFQIGGRPPSWNCFTTIRDHPWSLCCWLQLPVKFHINLIHRSEDIVIWIFRIYLVWNTYSGPQNGDFVGLWTINVIVHHRDPQRAHPCVNLRLLSYQL